MELAESVSRRLRSQHVLAGLVTVEIKYSSFESVSHQTQLVTPDNTTDTIYKTALRLFDELWNRQPYVCSAFVPLGFPPIRSGSFPSLTFRQMKSSKSWIGALDQIRQKFGDRSVIRASQLKKPSRHR